jgi:ceramide glucosyltransferase
MGRRIWDMGKRVEIIPYFVDTMVDLEKPSQWWSHQVYWDQNTRAARPYAFFATALVRSVPFSILYAAAQGFSALGLGVMTAAVLLRVISAAAVLGWGLRDREGLRSLWLLVLRDISSLVTWLLAFTKRTTIWRGTSFILTRDGRLVAKEAGS